MSLASVLTGKGVTKAVKKAITKHKKKVDKKDKLDPTPSSPRSAIVQAQQFKKIQSGMQMNANRRVARELVSLGFNNKKEYNQIVQQMNDRTINEYYGKY